MSLEMAKNSISHVTILFISSNASATKDSLTNTYPSACSSASAASLSYFSHLTMSKDGFTAVGNVCEGGVPYHQFVKGTFVKPPFSGVVVD